MTMDNALEPAEENLRDAFTLVASYVREADWMLEHGHVDAAQNQLKIAKRIISREMKNVHTCD